jgi:hypothetical protein
MQTEQKTARIIVHPAIVDFLNQKNNFIYVRPYSPGELAVLYGVGIKTFRTWTKSFEGEMGKRVGRYFTVRQVKFIFEQLDIPHMMQVA